MSEEGTVPTQQQNNAPEGPEQGAVKDERLPWFVGYYEQDMSIIPVTDEGRFRTQAEADAWIKEHITENGKVFVSLRFGRKFQAVTKVIEV